MKNFLLSIAIFSLFSFKSFSHVDHYASFNYLEYELFRNNKSIGYHKFDFRRNGENLSIISEVNFKITKLGVDLYKSTPNFVILKFTSLITDKLSPSLTKSYLW